MGSPFDYRSHALLYVARHLPDRRAPGAEEALHEELAHLLEAAGGRTLALFTSRRATEAAADALAPELPYTLLRQGDLPKGRLLEEFARDETSCLFATLGFWQGVDVPGRALSLVTIDRLPFPRPDDPLLQARRDRAGGRAFSAGRPAAGGHAAGAGRGPSHPQRRRPRRGRRPRPPARHVVVPRRPAGHAAAHAALGGSRGGGVVPAARARGRRRVGATRRSSKARVPSASTVPSVATRMTQRPATGATARGRGRRRARSGARRRRAARPR